MELLSTDGLFISGKTCKPVDANFNGAGVKRKQTDAGPAQQPVQREESIGHLADVAANDDDDSEYEVYTEPEPEDEEEVDTGQVDVFEELFGYRRRAGAARSTDAKFLAVRESRGDVVHVKPDVKAKAPKVQKEPKPSAGMSIVEMLEAGLFQPGLQNVTLTCKKSVYTASLTEDGGISYQGKTFRTPDAFSLFIKKQTGHHRPGGNGWRSVHVDGTPLEEWWGLMPPPPAGSVPSRRTESKKAQDSSKKQRSLRSAQPEAAVAAQQVEEEEDGTANWVQCSSCSQWRVVPDSFWPMIEASDNQEWWCKAATWDVTQYEPYTPICGQ